MIEVETDDGTKPEGAGPAMIMIAVFVFFFGFLFKEFVVDKDEGVKALKSKTELHQGK